MTTQVIQIVIFKLTSKSKDRRRELLHSQLQTSQKLSLSRRRQRDLKSNKSSKHQLLSQSNLLKKPKDRKTARRREAKKVSPNQNKRRSPSKLKNQLKNKNQKELSQPRQHHKSKLQQKPQQRSQRKKHQNQLQ